MSRSHRAMQIVAITLFLFLGASALAASTIESQNNQWTGKGWCALAFPFFFLAYLAARARR